MINNSVVIGLSPGKIFNKEIRYGIFIYLEKSHDLINSSTFKLAPLVIINVVAGLVAYSYQDKKPSLNIKMENLYPLLN